ncbi:MAG TPA: DUF6064 family protein [Noviherbaspirillum sp.]
MTLPFTVGQFYDVFRAYNDAVWPAQAGLLALAVAAASLVMVPRPWSGRAVSGILALLWAWMAIGYHLAFFTTINPLAYGFAAVFLAGALVFVWQGVVGNRLRYRLCGSAMPLTGSLLILFALVLYPLWLWGDGHRYPATPTFGLPCPTTIFTVGILCFLTRPYPRAVFVVPLLWSLFGAQAAFMLNVPPDLGLFAAAAVAALMMARSRPRPDSQPA